MKNKLTIQLFACIVSNMASKGVTFIELLEAAQMKKFPTLTDAAVAERIGLSRQLYWSYKSAKATPTLEKLILLVHSLEINPADIFRIDVKKA